MLGVGGASDISLEVCLDFSETIPRDSLPDFPSELDLGMGEAFQPPCKNRRVFVSLRFQFEACQLLVSLEQRLEKNQSIFPVLPGIGA